MNRRALISAFFCIIFCSVLRLVSLGYPALSDPSEGRYAAIAQTMVESRDWVSPRTHVDGEIVPFLGKPPLHAWLTSLSYLVFGETEAAARLPSYLSGLVVIAALATAALVMFGAEAAVLATLLLISSAVFFIFSGGCLTDPVLSACITGAMSAFAVAAHVSSASVRRSAWLICAFALGLGMLAKGPVAIVIPLLAVGLWVVGYRRITWAKTIPWAACALIFLATCLPWFLISEHRQPGFLRYFFVNENFLRYLVKDYGDKYGHGHRFPYGMIWLMLVASTLPWAFAVFCRPPVSKLLRGLSDADRSKIGLVLGWAVAPAVFFTFARQISFAYVLPAIPGAALLFAVIVREVLASDLRERLLSFFRLNIFISLIVSAALIAFAAHSGEERGTLLFSIVLLTSFTAGVVLLRRQSAPAPLGTVYVSTCATVLMFTVLLFSIDDRLDGASSKELVEFFQDAYPVGTPLGFIHKTPHSAYFYGRDDDVSLQLVSLEPSEMRTTSMRFLAAPKRDFERNVKLDLGKFRVIKDFGRWVLLTSG